MSRLTYPQLCEKHARTNARAKRKLRELYLHYKSRDDWSTNDLMHYRRKVVYFIRLRDSSHYALTRFNAKRDEQVARLAAR